MRFGRARRRAGVDSHSRTSRNEPARGMPRVTTTTAPCRFGRLARYHMTKRRGPLQRAGVRGAHLGARAEAEGRQRLLDLRRLRRAREDQRRLRVAAERLAARTRGPCGSPRNAARRVRGCERVAAVHPARARPPAQWVPPCPNGGRPHSSMSYSLATYGAVLRHEALQLYRSLLLGRTSQSRRVSFESRYGMYGLFSVRCLMHRPSVVRDCRHRTCAELPNGD